MSETDDICQSCFKSKTEHSLEQTRECSIQLIDMGIMRYCSLCGATKPAEKVHDRCGKCGEKYSFSNA